LAKNVEGNIKVYNEVRDIGFTTTHPEKDLTNGKKKKEKVVRGNT